MRSYCHFTLTERENLQELFKEGNTIRQIAIALGRSPSTISRELARNKNKDGGYHPWRATSLYIYRRHRSRRPYKLDIDNELYTWVCSGFKKFWSPQIITELWKAEHQGDKLSHSTIYRALKSGRIPKCAPKTHLRRHGKRYTHKSATIKPQHLIREWPIEIVNRERLGDWEGDTVHGRVGKGMLVTLVDRKSRFLTAALVHNKKAEATSLAIIEALSGQSVNSLSLDNGSEFAGFKELEDLLNTTIYFADPHSPWQRGSNENINDLLRFFFPKQTNFHTVTQETLNNALWLINNRPRKCLGWLSPIEFRAKCCT